MAFHRSLNAACNLNKYLFCKMPKGALEVEVKVKTTWGKFTMVQNTHTRMEKYHTWEKAQRCHIKSRKGRTPHKAASVHTEDNTSETDIPTGQGFGYPLQIFTNPYIYIGYDPHRFGRRGKTWNKLFRQVLQIL